MQPSLTLRAQTEEQKRFARLKRKGERHKLEDQFVLVLAGAGLLARFTREYRFDVPQPGQKKRRWKIDFADVPNKIAVEIEGGLFVYGGHNRGRDYIEDLEKYNALTVQGWKLLRYAELPGMREFPEQYRKLLGETSAKKS